MQKAADLPPSACFDSPNPPQSGKKESHGLWSRNRVEAAASPHSAPDRSVSAARRKTDLPGFVINE